ncbi:MAG: alpha/beta hydrolase, partial [Planctomycetaceae bacterium]|nr:alpha/beta hydrolase [Planctomycetaceae bacterium]
IEQVRSMVLPIAGEPERVGGVLSEVVPSASGEIPVRVYTPLIDTAELDEMETPETGRPMLMFFHGGGWVTGSIETHEAICRRLANECRSLVISVDYRLAPEHKFPAAIDDSYAATQWALDRAEHLGGDPARLFVCGDSAGGNLAAAVCLRARKEDGPAVRGQILIYPITDFNFETPSYTENASGYHLTADNMRWFWQQYLADESDGNHPLASPLRASDLSGLPATLMVTVEADPLRDEGLAYADALAAAGVHVDQIHCLGMVHGFFRRLDTFDRAGRLVEEIAQWMHGHDR